VLRERERERERERKKKKGETVESMQRGEAERRRVARVRGNDGGSEKGEGFLSPVENVFTYGHGRPPEGTVK
jgi:hypothetical protein